LLPPVEPLERSSMRTGLFVNTEGSPLATRSISGR